MSEYERDTAFLRRMICYDDTPDIQRLDESLTQVQRKERCVRRAIWFMVGLTALAAVGVGYCAVLLSDHPENVAWFFRETIVTVFAAVGLASLISLSAFTGLGWIYRKEAGQQRDQCRRVAASLLESRLGTPRSPAPPGTARERVVLDPVVSSPQ